jgi:recombination protein RecT
MSDKPQAPALAHYSPITKVKTLQELWDHPGLKKAMESLLPRHLHADRMLRTLSNAALKTPGLAKASPLSMLGAAMTIGYLGLEPNTPLQLMHLIPFEVSAWNPKKREREYVRTDITPIIGYQGYLDLIARAEKVQGVPTCKLIWPGDEWEQEDGSNFKFRHIERHRPHAPDAEPDYAYMYVRLRDGGEYAEVMTRADIHRIRNNSQGYKAAIAARDAGAKAARPYVPLSYTEAPWIKHPLPMFRKTPLRIGQKYLPKSAELGVAISLDEAGDDGRVRFDHVLEAEAVSEGAWEVPQTDYDTDLAPEETERSTKTQVQVKTPDAPKRAAAPTQARTETPPPSVEGPPEDRWGPPPEDDAGARGTAAGAPDDVAPPSQDAQASASASNTPPAFEGWLFDEAGEIVGDDPYLHPKAYAEALAVLWHKSENRDALVAHNADGIADAKKASPRLWGLFSSNAAKESAVVPYTTAGAYLKAFKAAAAGLTADTYLDFIAANREQMIKTALGTRSLCLKVLVERASAIGVEAPRELAAALNVAPTAGTQTASAEQPPKPVDPVEQELEKDTATLKARCADYDACKTLSELIGIKEGLIIRRFIDRMKSMGESRTTMLASLEQSFQSNHERLSPR